MDNLIGLIPAAGKGLRLGLPYPKELYPIIHNNKYKPVSQYILENLTGSGVGQVIFVINETKHQLIGYFGDGHRFNCDISYVVQENREDPNSSTSPGLAHALNSAYHLTKEKTVCFGMADTVITPIDIYSQLVQAAGETDDVILGLFVSKQPQKSGMVQFDHNLIVRKIVDKPLKTDLIYGWGLIVWRPRFTEHLYNCIQENHIFDFAQVMNTAIEEGMVIKGIPFDKGTFTDLGTYDEIMEMERKHRAR